MNDRLGGWKFYLLAIFMIVLLVFLMWAADKSFAATYHTDTSGTGTYGSYMDLSVNPAGTCSGGYEKYYAQNIQFTGTTGELLDSVSQQFFDIGAPYLTGQQVYVEIWGIASATSSPGSGALLATSSPETLSTPPETLTFLFDHYPSLVNNAFYQFVFRLGPNCISSYGYAGAETALDTWHTGYDFTSWLYYAPGGGWIDRNNTVYYEVPYFNFSTSPPATPTSISITAPSNGSTATSSPGYSSSGTFTLGDANLYLYPPQVEIKLSYHSTSTGSDLSTLMDDYVFSAGTATTTQNWSRSLPLNLANATAASSTYWQVQALIHDPVFTSLIVASSTSDFYVDITGSFLPPPPISVPGSYSTSTGSVLASCNDSGINLIQAALCYLFVPQLSSFSQFGNLYSQIINKPPIGYLGAISGIIDGTSTASTSLDNLTLPTSTSSPFTLFRSSMGWILWLFFGGFIFNRIRHFNLW